jgi:hypothetical protein
MAASPAELQRTRWPLLRTSQKPGPVSTANPAKQFSGRARALFSADW